VPESTGVLVAPGDDEEVVGGFVAAIRAFDPDLYDRAQIRAWAEGFSRASFRGRMQQVMDGVLTPVAREQVTVPW